MIDIVTREIKVVSEANRREHWTKRAARAKHHRQMAWALTVRQIRHQNMKPPLSILLTRLGSRSLDTDNLAGSFKHVRDGIADALEIDDGSNNAIYSYAQARDKVPGIRIQIAPFGSLADQIARAKPGDWIIVPPSTPAKRTPAHDR